MADAISTLKLTVDTGGAVEGLKALTESLERLKTGLLQLDKVDGNMARLQAEVEKLRGELRQWQDGTKTATQQAGDAFKNLAGTVSSSAGSMRVSLKQTLDSMDETHLGLQKLNKLGGEGQRAFAKGFDRGEWIKGYELQLKQASDKLNEFEKAVRLVRRARDEMVAGSELGTLTKEYGTGIEGFIRNLSSLEAKLTTMKAAVGSLREAKLGSLGLDNLDSAVIKLDTRLKNGLKVLEARRREAESKVSEVERLARREAKFGGLGLDLLDSAVIRLDTRLKNAMRAVDARKAQAETQMTELERFAKRQVKFGGLGLDSLDSAIIRLDTRLKNGLKVLEARKVEAEKAVSEADKLARREVRFGNLGLDLLGAAVIRLDTRLKNGLKVLETRKAEAEKAITDAEKLARREAKFGSLGLDLLGTAVIQLDSRLKNGLRALTIRTREAEKAMDEAEKLARRETKYGSLGLNLLGTAVIQLDSRLKQDLKAIEARKAQYLRMMQDLKKDLQWSAGDKYTSRGQVVFAAAEMRRQGFSDEDLGKVFHSSVIRAIPSLSQYEKAINQIGNAQQSTSNASKMAALAAREWASAGNEAHSAARGLAGSLGLLWVTWGSTIPLVAAAALGGAIRQTFTVGKDLEYQLVFVKELAGGTAISFQQFGEAVRGSQFGVIEAAEGLRALAQQGLSSQDALRALPDILRLATVGELGVAQAAYGATGVMNAFNLSVSDLGRIGDVFAKAAAVSNTSVSAMVESMKQASTVGDMFNVTLEETAATLAVMAKRNIDGSAAGTAFRNMLKEMAAPTDHARQAMAKLNVEIYEGGNKLKPYPAMVEELANKVALLNEKGRITFLNDLFGERGAKAINALLSDYEEFSNVLDTLNQRHLRFVKGVSDALEQTTQGKLRQFVNELQLTFAGAYETAQPAIKGLLDSLTEVARSKEFKNFIADVTTGVANLTQFLMDHGRAVMVVVGAYAALKVVSVISGAFAAMNLAFAQGTGALGMLANAAKSFLLYDLYGAGMKATSGLMAMSSGALAAVRGIAALMNPVTAVLATIGMGVWAWLEYKDAQEESTRAAREYGQETDRTIEALDREIRKVQEETAAIKERNRALLAGAPSGGYTDALAKLKGADTEYEQARKTTQSWVDYKAAVEQAAAAGKVWIKFGNETVTVTEAMARANQGYNASLAYQKETFRRSAEETPRAVKLVGETLIQDDASETQRAIRSVQDTNRQIERAIKQGRADLKDLKVADIGQFFSGLTGWQANEKAEKLKDDLNSKLADFKPADRNAGRLAKEEMRGIQQEYDAEMRALGEAFNFEKQRLDQRVRFGALSQGAANVLLESKQDEVWTAELNAANKALKEYETQIKASDAATAKRLENEKAQVEAKKNHILMVQENTLRLREEREELMKFQTARDLQKSLGGMEDKEKLARDKFDIEHSKKYIDPVKFAGDQAYEASIQNTSEEVQKWANKVKEARFDLDTLTQSLMDAKEPNAEMAAQLEKQTEDYLRYADALKKATEKQEELAEARRKQAQDQAVYDMSFEGGTTRAFQAYRREAMDAGKAAEHFWSGSLDRMTDALVEFAETGKFNWKDMVDFMGKELLKISMREMMASIIPGSVSGGSSGSGFWGGLIQMGLNAWSGNWAGVFSGAAGMASSSSGPSYTASGSTSRSGWLGDTSGYKVNATEALGNVYANTEPVRAFAKGGSFTNRVFATPTHFRYGGKRDKLGVMGEAGPEAIMPLSRTRDGRLGVRMLGGRAGLEQVLPLARDGAGRLSVMQASNDSQLKRYANGGTFGDTENNVPRLFATGGSFATAPSLMQRPLPSPPAPTPNQTQASVQSQRPIQVTMNIQTPDANSFRQSHGQVMAEMNRALAVGRRNM